MWLLLAIKCYIEEQVRTWTYFDHLFDSVTVCIVQTYIHVCVMHCLRCAVALVLCARRGV